MGLRDDISFVSLKKKMDEPSYTDDEVPTKKNTSSTFEAIGPGKVVASAVELGLGGAKWWHALRGEPSN